MPEAPGSTPPASTSRPRATTPDPPPTRREELVEVHHGLAVADPYRWLEASADDPEIRAFVAAQNAVTAAHLAALPARDEFRRRLRALWDHPRRGAPWRRGDRWFQVRNDGLQNQDVLWSAPASDPHVPPDDSWSVLLDPNAWSEAGTASLSAVSVSRDGRLVAFARSDAGSDWLTWQVVDVGSERISPERIRWAKFSSAAWLPDGSGFVYGAYRAPATGHEHDAATRDQQLRLHRLGTDPHDDLVVYERPDQPEWGFEPHVSHDGRWLVATVWRGTDPTNRVHVAPLTEAGVGPWRPLLDRADAAYHVVGVLDDELLVVTDLAAPLGRVAACRLSDSDADPPHLREVVAEEVDRLQQVVLVGGDTPGDPAWLVCSRLRHATARLAVHRAHDGGHLHDLELDGPSTVGAITGGRPDRGVHLTVETFTAPSAIVHHDLATARTRVTSPPALASPDALVVEQVRVHHAGVAVPLFLVHRRDVLPNGRVPTVLWGYGGFDIPVTPAFRPGWRAWVDAGGLLAVACLRGGGEYGRAWHDAGRLRNKERVFDDALACAAWLTGRRRDRIVATSRSHGGAAASTDARPEADAADVDVVWSAPGHLGVEGRSNGGLLVGACLTREPAAFGSAVPEVSVLDLARFHRFTIGWAWTSDYGSPDDPEDLAVLLRYSPYHRIAPGTAYPATLITTGDTDDRVVPAHSYKFAAALQHAQAGEAPILLRVDVAAGHGAGKPVDKVLDERADVLAFHAEHLGLSLGLGVGPDPAPRTGRRDRGG
jgi:prolyl oligopeptidase